MKKSVVQVFVFPSADQANQYESSRYWRGAVAAMVKKKGRTVILWYRSGLCGGSREMARRLAINMHLANELGARIHTSSSVRTRAFKSRTRRRRQ